ncbi:hypothetical protein [Ruminococcus champanellensis]|uniref:hypothetical protein n=1 Tax=Ruminococcus champanellensis TaxID=1161942 RepID=UPI0023EF684C|nr:hypothetical protein [Ruminococcus champanellensis]
MTKYNAYGLKTIKKYAEMGKQFAQEGLTWERIIDRLPESKMFDQDILKFVDIGYRYGDKIEIVEKEFYRIGEPTIDCYGNCYHASYNYAEDKPEDGISVVTTAWLHSMKSVFFGAHDDEKLQSRGVYKIKGVVVGFGGDDEPLIYATDWAEKTRIRTYNGLEKAVAKNN